MQSTDKRQSKTNHVFNFSNWRHFTRQRLPGQVVIQYTDRCNASCVQCGMRQSNKYPRSTLNVDDTKRLLDAMAEQGVQAVSFTGGEPLLCLQEIAECIRHARAIGIPYVRTGTNGFLFKGVDKPEFESKIHRVAETLAEAGLYTFWVSVDSAVPAVHEQNRGLPNTIAGMARGIPIFHAHGLYPSANLGINRYVGGYEQAPSPESPFDADRFYAYFQQSFRQFYQFVESLGFTIVNACYPMSLDEQEMDDKAVYTATSADAFIRFSEAEKLALFKALFDVIPEFRDKLRIFTPRSALLALIRQYEGKSAESYACRGGIDFFFVDAQEMNTYPCGYRGAENLGKFWDLHLSELTEKPWCKQCDWECFRDPSELIGPVLDLFSQPWQLIKKLSRDRIFAKVWLEDIRYYRACRYFDATLPPDFRRLAKFRHDRFKILQMPNSADISKSSVATIPATR